MKKVLIIIVLLCVGCVHSQKQGNFTPANLVKNEAITVEMPKALSPVSQLIKVEKFEASQARMNPMSGINEAYSNAIQEPVQFINAVTVYPYTQGKVFKIYCSPLHITTLIFQENEQIITYAAGDTVRWLVDKMPSGTGKESRENLIIKPTEKGLNTNLIISTNKRIYFTELKSYQNTYQTGVSWHYAEDELKAKINQAQKQIIENPIANINLAALNFGYRIQGRTEWTPERVFDDGAKTYIKFPVSIQELPPLFIMQSDQAQMVNYRYRQGYYIVDRLFKKALLQIGKLKVYIEKRG